MVVVTVPSRLCKVLAKLTVFDPVALDQACADACLKATPIEKLVCTAVWIVNRIKTAGTDAAAAAFAFIIVNDCFFIYIRNRIASAFFCSSMPVENRRSIRMSVVAATAVQKNAEAMRFLM